MGGLRRKLSQEPNFNKGGGPEKIRDRPSKKSHRGRLSPAIKVIEVGSVDSGLKV